MAMTRMQSIIGGFVIAVGMDAAGTFLGASAPSHQEQPPAPIAAQWPFNLDRRSAAGIEGAVRLTVRVERGVVVGAGVADDALPELARAGLEAVSTWRFSSTVSVTLATTFSHRLDGSTGCGGDDNQTIRAQLPASVEVVSTKYVAICDPLPTVDSHQPVSKLSGRVICTCASKEPVGGARLSVFEGSNQDRAEARAIRNVLTDSDGQFRVLGLRPGSYRIDINEDDFRPMRYTVKIDPSSNPDPVEIGLHRRSVQPPPTHVIAGTIPTYPVSARASGVQGEVGLRLSMQDDEVLDVDADSDNQVLANAATSNVRTWKFRDTTVPVLSIRFRYVIDPGDCHMAGPLVTMQFPHTVTVRAVGIPCAPLRSRVPELLPTRPGGPAR